MSEYHSLVEKISVQTGAPFRSASSEDLATLRSFNLPQSIIDFYAKHEPTDCAEGQVRLWAIKHIAEENRNFVPGTYTAPLGYVVFASTFCGDAYCFNINNCKTEDEPGIVLISHEVIEESTMAMDVARLAKPVAKNLRDFLEKFVCATIDEECVYD